MASSDAKKFIDAINNDPALQAKVQAAQGQMVDVAKEAGFDVSHDELHDELRQRWDVSKSKDDPDTCTFA